MVPILQAAVTELRSEKEKMLIETARRCEDWGAEKGSLLERVCSVLQFAKFLFFIQRNW